LAALAVAAGGIGLVVTMRPWRAVELPAAERVPLARSARVDRVRFLGVPERLAGAMRTALDWQPGQIWGPGMPARVARDLETRFPCVREVDAERTWSEHSVDFVVTLRRPVAFLGSGKSGDRFLGEGGGLFTAPEGLFPEEGLPRADLKGLPDDADLGKVSRWLAVAGGADGLPAPMREVRFDKASGGWSVALADGTHLRWGDLRWTREKLRRLKEVLADASARFGKGLTADLRHFEQGKILIRSE